MALPGSGLAIDLRVAGLRHRGVVRRHVEMIMRLKNLRDEIALFLDFGAGHDIRTDGAIDFVY